jgi:hypothetical protein
MTIPVHPSFFTPIEAPDLSLNMAGRIGKAADSYLGGRKVVWEKQGWLASHNWFKQDTDREENTNSKVILGIATLGLLPLAALVIKTLYRHRLFNHTDGEALYELGQNAKGQVRVDYYLQAAKKGNTSAMRDLGDFYSQKESLDEKKAIYWLTKAAQKGNTEAMYMLGRLYRDGVIAKDRGKALYWLQKAAADPNPSIYKTLAETALEQLKKDHKNV